MTILVVDTETTGFTAGIDAVVEVAGCVLDPWSTFSSLVAPGRIIPPEALAVHHIRNEDVRDAPKLPWAVDQMLRELRLKFTLNDVSIFSDFYVAAHNAAFDMEFVGAHLPDVPVICTWVCAKHLYPDENAYSNQALRYSLNLDVECRRRLGDGGVPHRALYDAVVTSVILEHMLRERSPQELHELSTRPVLQKTCRFGNKHRGWEWSAVPKDYIRWMLKLTDLDPDTRHTAEHWSRM